MSLLVHPSPHPRLLPRTLCHCLHANPLRRKEMGCVCVCGLFSKIESLQDEFIAGTRMLAAVHLWLEDDSPEARALGTCPPMRCVCEGELSH